MLDALYCCQHLISVNNNRMTTSLPSYYFCDWNIGKDLPAVLARAVALRSLVVVSAVVDGCSPIESNYFRGMKQSLVFCQIVDKESSHR